jgi:hypothetical protein
MDLIMSINFKNIFVFFFVTLSGSGVRLGSLIPKTLDATKTLKMLLSLSKLVTLMDDTPTFIQSSSNSSLVNSSSTILSLIYFLLDAKICTFLQTVILPNELRIDAAEGGEAKRKGHCAAASVRVGLGRIWKKKPGVTGKNITRTNAHR